MEHKASRMIIETLVRKALRDIKDSPERSMRNMVDMALNFSQGRFQQRFFSAAQTMLQNQNSAYYGMVLDLVTHVENENILCFGMNLGYNSCTWGAKQIRAVEEAESFNIPWTIWLQIDTETFAEKQARYDEIVSQGEAIGVYFWMLFCENESTELLSFIDSHPDSAFILFCSSYEMSPAFLDHLPESSNLMLALPFDEEQTELLARLREHKLLYSVYVRYTEEDLASITSGELFIKTEQIHPMFTILIADPSCPKPVSQTVYETVLAIRNDQRYRTIPWEWTNDSLYIDSIISQDSCLAGFDRHGILHSVDQEAMASYDLFQMELPQILRAAFPKSNAFQHDNAASL